MDPEVAEQKLGKVGHMTTHSGIAPELLHELHIALGNRPVCPDAHLGWQFWRAFKRVDLLKSLSPRQAEVLVDVV